MYEPNERPNYAVERATVKSREQELKERYGKDPIGVMGTEVWGEADIATATGKFGNKVLVGTIDDILNPHEQPLVQHPRPEKGRPRQV